MQNIVLCAPHRVRYTYHPMKTAKVAEKSAVPAAERPADKPTLGRVLRALRARNDWTLKEMSDRTGIPLSTLSKVEHDRLSLTYDKLLELSQRLNLRMSELFSEPEAAPPPGPFPPRRKLGPPGGPLRVNSPHFGFLLLGPDLRRKRMVPVVTRV